MGLDFTPSGGEKELIPAGSYLARVISIVDLGTQTVKTPDGDKRQPKIRIAWELPDCLDDKGIPRIVSRKVTKTLDDRGVFYTLFNKLVNGGLPSPDRASEFKVANLIGTVCYISIEHAKLIGTNDKYPKVTSTMLPPPGVAAKAQHHKSVVFDLSRFDPAAFAELPEYWKEDIKKSEQWRDIGHLAVAPAASSPPPQVLDDDDDEAPF